MYVYIFRSLSNPGLQMMQNLWDQRFSLHVNNRHTWKHLTQFELSSQCCFPFSLYALKFRLINFRIRFWGSKILRKKISLVEKACQHFLVFLKCGAKVLVIVSPRWRVIYLVNICQSIYNIHLYQIHCKKIYSLSFSELGKC